MIQRLLLGSFLIVLLVFLSANHADAGYYEPGPAPTITPNKTVFQPGEEVTLKLDYPFEINDGDTIFLSVINGGDNGKTVFYTAQPLFEKSTEIKFNIPKEEQNYDRYQIKTQIQQQHNKALELGPVWIYSKQGSEIQKINDFSIDKDEVRPGDTIHIKFQVTDDTGKAIPDVSAQISLCKDMPEQHWFGISTPYTTKKLQELEQKQPGVYQYYCDISYPNIFSMNDTFDIKFRIYDTITPGNYKLVVFGIDPVYSGFVAKASKDIFVNGEPIPSTSPDTFVFTDVKIPRNYDQSWLPVFKKGDEIVFSPRQVSEGEYLLDKGQKLVTAGINYRIFIKDPYGKIVFENDTTVDKNGNFGRAIFPISYDAVPGIYDVYYYVTKDGNFLYNTEGTMYSFQVTNSQTFSVNAEKKTFDIAFQSLDLKASNISFDQQAKLLSFDVDKIDGIYNDRYFHSWSVESGTLKIIMEKPLLTGPYLVLLDDKPVLTMWYPSQLDLQANIVQLQLEQINKSGKITIIGTHVVPEFGMLVSLILAVSFISALVVFRAKIGKNL